MKGTILDFLKLTSKKMELAKELVELAAKYDFEFSDEVSDQELDAVAGGTTEQQMQQPNSEYQHLDQVVNAEMQGLARLQRALGTIRTGVGLSGQEY